MTFEAWPFDPAAYLDSPEAMLAYFEGAFADGDAGEIADGLGVVARTRDMSQLAEETGLTRQALYKALSSDGNPEVRDGPEGHSRARLPSASRARLRRLTRRSHGYGSVQWAAFGGPRPTMMSTTSAP